jgi:hypothetical protein
VNLANDSKLTVGAAVSAAADGDMIVIWPGDYNEAVDASAKALIFAGTSRHKSRIRKTTAGTVLKIGSNSVVRNLSVETTSTSIALDGQGKSNIVIEACDLVGSYDGLNIYNANHVLIRDCFASGKYDGANFGSVDNLVCERSIFVSDGTYGTSTPSRGAHVDGRAIFRDCVFAASRNDASTWPTYGLECNNAVAGGCLVTLVNCILRASAGASDTGETAALKAGSGSRVAASNCAFYAAGTGGGTAADIINNSGASVVVAACAYGATAGTIKVLDAFSPVDSSGRVDIGRIKGTDAASLEKAAKMLTNKATQDKLTGAITYFDDDGETALLTHTPVESESSLTRQVG